MNYSSRSIFAKKPSKVRLLSAFHFISYCGSIRTSPNGTIGRTLKDIDQYTIGRTLNDIEQYTIGRTLNARCVFEGVQLLIIEHSQVPRKVRGKSFLKMSY